MAPPSAYVQPLIPPPVVHTNPNHVAVAMPAPVRQPAPPVHYQPQPPVHQPMGMSPPVRPPQKKFGVWSVERQEWTSDAPPPAPMPTHTPAQPSAPSIPAHMAPYAKMKKFGLGEWQIKGKMKTNGHDETDYDRYLGDGASAAAPPPTPMGRAPPPHHANVAPAPAARRPAPVSFLDSIRQGNKLKTASQQPPRPARVAPSDGGMMAAIRAGAKLKKATNRAPAPPKVKTGRDAMLDAIQKKASGNGLKKAQDRVLKEKEPVEETGNIFALLKLRAKIADSDDDDSDGSGSWDSDEES